MSTLKKWLDDAGFDWESGKILWQETEYEDGNGSPGWDDPINACFISGNHAVIHREFCDGFGGPECPRIIAEDEDCLYFPSQYDGATSLTVVFKDLRVYLDYKRYFSPYPGG